MNNFVPLPPEGKIMYFTIVKKKSPYTDWPVPFIYAGIQFTGAHTIFWHRIKNTDKITVGDMVKAVFLPKDKRQGSILDIDYFEKF
jgi:uncharacterized OB-fold protein